MSAAPAGLRLGIRDSAMPAWRALQAALADAPTPCAASDAWTSEDPAERATAARGCTGCPAMAACGRFADDNHETAGVWAGVDRTARAGRPPAAQPKERTA